MKYTVLLSFIAVAFLGACAAHSASPVTNSTAAPEAAASQTAVMPTETSPSASVPNNPDAKAAQAIVEKYIAADQSQSYDPEALIALYANDATWTDQGETSIGVIDKPSFKDFFTTYWYPPDRQVKFVSYLITSDGTAAVVQATLTRPSNLSNQLVSAPVTIILELKNGLIEKETWYYNEDLIH